MDNLISSQPAPQTAADYEAAVDAQIKEMKSLNSQMHTDRAEINRLEAETESLKAEAHRLKRETRKLLASMGLVL